MNRNASPAPYFLGIGELIASPHPIVVSTTLGSCVSVCLFTDSGRAGGINHFALPTRMHGHVEEGDELRFGDFATRQLVAEVASLVGSRHLLRAKVIGGGQIMGDEKIGSANIQMAHTILAELGIPIVGEATGGRGGWKVFFSTDSGRLRYCRLETPRSSPPVKKLLPAKPVQPTPPPQQALNKSAPLPQPHSATPAVATPAVLKPAKRKILIVDDSATVRQMLSASFAHDPELEVVGAVSGPTAAHPLLATLEPDVMTLDIHMPDMDGVTYLERLRPQDQVRILMLTSLSPEDGGKVFRALELGALDYVQKPRLSDLASASAQLCEKIKAVADARQVRSHKSTHQTRSRTLNSQRTSRMVLAIGASTGGTEAIKAVLTVLPAEVPPILIVQHIPPVFSATFARRLSEICAFEVKEAEDGDRVKAGRALIAPGGRHMRLKREASGGLVVVVDDGVPVNRHKPSVDVLFESVAQTMGRDAIGVILTGMGNDGAKGLLAMSRQQCLTIGQSEETCVVYGMPKAAAEIGAVKESIALHSIAERLVAALSSSTERSQERAG